MKEIGALLKAAREAKGLSLEEIRSITKIRIQQLEALEAGEFDRLPGEVYVKGFLVSFAQAVGLDGEAILKKYYEDREAQIAAQAGAGEQDIAVSSPPPAQVQLERPAPREKVKGRPGKRKLAVAVIAAVCILLTGLGWFSFSKSREPVVPESGKVVDTPAPETNANRGPIARTDEPTVPAGEAATPTVEQPATGAEVETNSPAAEPLLKAEAVEPVWLGVYEKETGKILFEGTLYPPETREWLLSGDVTLRIGNAGGLRLNYRGEDLGALGYSGQVLTKEIKMAE